MNKALSILSTHSQTSTKAPVKSDMIDFRVT